jgi:hypothetical protein
MSADIVVTAPKDFWESWLEEGDLPGDKPTPNYWSFYCRGAMPGRVELTGEREAVQEAIGLAAGIDDLDNARLYAKPDQRCYVVAHGRLRGYAPLYAIETNGTGRELRAFIRRAGAVAITVPESIRGFRGWKYRWWDRAAEVAFPDWKTEGVTGQPKRSANLVGFCP